MRVSRSQESEARGWRSLGVGEKVFSIVWWAVAAACLVSVGFAGSAWLIDAAFGLLAVAMGIAGPAGWSWKPRLAFSLVTGTILILYGGALILGTEDVGGFGVSLPFGLSGIALGFWSIFLPPWGEKKNPST